MDLHAWITRQVDRIEAAALELATNPAATLRRCEADRRILAIHYSVSDGYMVACDGCGTAGICDYWITENINDCPILLAVAHAHGITPEILAGLDRPQPPEQKPRTERYANGDILTPPITTSDVPEALRGPRWKGRS